MPSAFVHKSAAVSFAAVCCRTKPVYGQTHKHRHTHRAGKATCSDRGCFAACVPRNRPSHKRSAFLQGRQNRTTAFAPALKRLNRGRASAKLCPRWPCTYSEHAVPALPLLSGTASLLAWRVKRQYCGNGMFSNSHASFQEVDCILSFV